MTRFALTLEFDGTPFFGLQRQSHGPSVQQSVEDALHRITGESVVMHSAGRTDAGVHALAMRSHVDIEKPFDPFRLMEALNAHLRPDPVAVTHCEVVPDDWHARFSCTGRRYLYRIANRRAPPALDKGKVWWVPKRLDAEAMHEAAKVLIGRHDFTTFRSTQCQANSPLRTLARLDVSRDDETIEIRASAQSFLHNQVRSMVGSLKRVGEGGWSATDLKAALEARDRAACGQVAPPDGLFLTGVDYPNS